MIRNCDLDDRRKNKRLKFPHAHTYPPVAEHTIERIGHSLRWRAVLDTSVRAYYTLEWEHKEPGEGREGAFSCIAVALDRQGMKGFKLQDGVLYRIELLLRCIRRRHCGEWLDWDVYGYAFIFRIDGCTSYIRRTPRPPVCIQIINNPISPIQRWKTLFFFVWLWYHSFTH